MQQAVRRFRAELVEEDERRMVLLHCDRPHEQLVGDAIELMRDWLRRTGIRTATLVDADGSYKLQS